VRQPGLSVQGTASGHAHSTKWLGCGRAVAQVQPRSARGRKLSDRAGLRHFRHRIILPVVGRSTLDDQRHLISAFAHSGAHGWLNSYAGRGASESGASSSSPLYSLIVQRTILLRSWYIMGRSILRAGNRIQNRQGLQMPVSTPVPHVRRARSSKRARLLTAASSGSVGFQVFPPGKAPIRQPAGARETQQPEPVCSEVGCLRLGCALARWWHGWAHRETGGAPTPMQQRPRDAHPRLSRPSKTSPLFLSHARRTRTRSQFSQQWWLRHPEVATAALHGQQK